MHTHALFVILKSKGRKGSFSRKPFSRIAVRFPGFLSALISQPLSQNTPDYV